MPTNPNKKIEEKSPQEEPSEWVIVDHPIVDIPEKFTSSVKKTTISPNTATFNFLNKLHKNTKGRQ